MARRKYKFAGRVDGVYYWSCPAPDYGSGYEEVVSCNVDWFWKEPELCMSRGPRIGDEGSPYCKRVKGHEGTHRPDPSDGWGPNMVWGNPW